VWVSLFLLVYPKLKNYLSIFIAQNSSMDFFVLVLEKTSIHNHFMPSLFRFTPSYIFLFSLFYFLV
jgi:hypothetical protein